jgi:hypothetical protein
MTRGVGGEHAVVQHKVRARAWRQRSELGNEVEWIEQHVGGSVVPWSFEPQRDAPVLQHLEAVFRDQRPRAIAQ